MTFKIARTLLHAMLDTIQMLWWEIHCNKVTSSLIGWARIQNTLWSHRRDRGESSTLDESITKEPIRGFIGHIVNVVVTQSAFRILGALASPVTQFWVYVFVLWRCQIPLPLQVRFAPAICWTTGRCPVLDSPQTRAGRSSLTRASASGLGCILCKIVLFCLQWMNS